MNIQITFSNGFLRDEQNVNILMQKMVNLKRGIIIRQEIGQDQSVISKFKFITQQGSANPIFSVKFWRNDDVIVPFMLLSSTFNIIIRSQINSAIDVGGSSNTIVISSLQDVSSIINMSLFEFQRRCRLQKLMRNTETKYNNNSNRESFRLIAMEYQKRKNQHFLRILHQFMMYNSKCYLRIVRKCWNLWLIQHYETTIAKTNTVIIEQQFFLKIANKHLMKSCLMGWKQLTFEK